MKKTLSVFIVVVMLIAMLIPVAAAIGITPFASDQLDSYGVTVTRMGSGVIRVQATINATHPRMTKLGFPTVTLFEYDGSKWNVVDTRSAVYTSNVGSHACTFDYQGAVGKKYYAGASFYGEDTAGSTSRTATSVTVTAN